MEAKLGPLRILNLVTDPGHIKIGDASGYPVARIPFALDLEYQAIAARIVLTWNCHNDLLAALEDLIEDTEAYSGGLGCVSCAGEPGVDNDGNDTEIKHTVDCRRMKAKAVVPRAKGGE